MYLRKVIDPDGTVLWCGTDRAAVMRAANSGGTISCVDVKGAEAVAALLNAERRDAAQAMTLTTERK